MKKIMCVVLSVALLVSAVFCVNAFSASAAETGSCGAIGSSVLWAYDSTSATLTLTGSGTTKNYGVTSTNPAPWKSVKTQIKNLVVGEGITTIGYSNFYGCTALISVKLPSTLTTIKGSTAGYGAFRECTSLESITFPSSLKTIETRAFEGCSALKNVTFPDSLTSLGNYAFTECIGIDTVTYGTGLTSTGSYAFYNAGVKNIVFSSTITAVDGYSFYGTKLTSVELPDTIASIGIRSFANCTFLFSATVNNANCTFNGIIGEDPFNGSSQSLVMYGHALSTTQTYAQEKGYKFVSIDSCSHLNTHEVVTLEPTCLNPGTTTQVCDDCGFVISETELPAKGHTYELITTDDQSAVDGHIYKTYQCVDCAEQKSEIEHVSYVDGYYTKIVVTEASCTRTGIERYSCTVADCGKSEIITTPKGAHQIDSYTVTREATCTTNGTRQGVCALCGETITETIAAPGHSNTVISTEVNTETGHTTVTNQCSVCNAKTVTMTHDNWVEGYYTSTVITAPTCTVNGVQRDVCNLCGESRLVTLTASGQHDWYETSRTESTCTANGRIYYSCHNCTLTKTENIPALGHDYVLDTINSIEPTCTTEGLHKYTCSRCSSASSESVPATGHTPVEDSIVVSKSATCEETGLATAKCSVCGVDYELIEAALGHDYQPVLIPIANEPGHAMSTPTCTRCNSTQPSSKVHQEWIDGYYTTEVVTEGSCTIARSTRDTCTICNTTRVNRTDAPGHKYIMTGTDDQGKFVYNCSVCGNQTALFPILVKPMWNVTYVNKAPDDATVTNGEYLDLNNDDVINAKDYAILSIANR